MPKLEYMDEASRRSMQNFPFLEFQTVPWTPLPKELSQCKVALVTSAALHLRTDKPFVARDKAAGDPSYRVIPSIATARDIIQSHVSIGFDRTGIYRDINIVFPVDRLRELVKRGAIGSLAEHFYSFSGGGQWNPRPVMRELGPEVARRLNEERVDVVFLTPI